MTDDDLLPEDEAQALFDPYSCAISDCWLSGLDAWVLNDLETGFAELVLVLKRDGKRVWKIDLAQERVVESVPTPMSEPIPATVRSTRPSEEVGKEAK